MQRVPRPCRGCLSADLPEGEALRQLMRELWQALTPDQRADEALYQQRLKLCRACEHLMSGLCRHCGCYVEARAMRRWQRCPDVPPRWLPEDEKEEQA